MVPGPGADREHRRVLVVDDDARARTAVARILAAEGYDATVAADGEEATGLLASWRPDLILTDLHMPRLDGRGLLRQVQSLLPGTPVIVVSGGRAEAGALPSGLGVAAFFSKPVEVDRLLVRIRELIGS